MTSCFKDQECDKQILNKNTRPVSACKSYTGDVNGQSRKIIEVPILTCECLWAYYQQEAEEIVAPGGVLIADPVARNSAINAAYARLWLHDSRFQWAGLAAFASKQVGCGLMHASGLIDNIRKEKTAQQNLRDLRRRYGLFTTSKMQEQVEAMEAYKQADANNPVPSVDIHFAGEPLSLMQQQFQHVNDMLALGNTSLFLDIFPLHAFYAKRGFKELETCLEKRANIHGDPDFSVLWPVDQEKLPFGQYRDEILQAFAAIESGDIAKSVEKFAWHEQKNILQPAIYEDWHLAALLRSNHVSYVTGFPSGVAEAIELTLASQCRRVDDGRTLGFSTNLLADLSDLKQRMAFVLRAAKRFDEMLHDNNRPLLEQSIRDIAAGNGVR
ncbi:MAG TPA: hypothetical protein VGC62_10955 [Pseudomonas sp.]|uniref:DUF2515 family protein n=1 Tax=Pseudomonas sp. TaxID=306 RepID=UPI002EDB392B